MLPNGERLANRIVKSAMSEALADARNNPTEALISLYDQWGQSGAAILILGNTPISRLHLEHASNFVLDEDTDKASAKRLVRAGQRGGARVLAQLAHAGRQTPESINPSPLSVSDLRLNLPGYGAPKVGDEEDFEAVIDQFAASAKQAETLGFDGVEIHAAHGYLLSSSLSPRINSRTDRWGGVLENRARLTVEAVRAVRQNVSPSFIVATKLNSSDFQKGGFDHEEAAQVARMLEGEGVDFIEISGGTFESPEAYKHTSKSESTKAREAYFLDYAATIKAALTIPLMVTGGFRSSEVMNAALAEGKTNLIGMGRPFIADPTFPKRLLEGTQDAAPSVERNLPPAAELPRGAGLNWFCTQLAILGQTGAPDLDLPVVKGHQRYLDAIEAATTAHLAARSISV